MRGLMMNAPLLVTSILRHAALYHNDTEVVSRSVEGAIHRATYGQIWNRTQQLAHALVGLGAQPGDRIGTLAWNTGRHLELYYAVSGAGMVCHTINPRLFAEQIAYIVNHAEDRYLFLDLTFVPLMESLQPHLSSVKGYVILTDDAHMPETTLPNACSYESLIAPQPSVFAWPELDENDAAALCYSSGTTGNPKGVLYSHRSCVLHAMAVAWADVFSLTACDVVMPVVPMFHVNAWGIPYAAPMMGSKLVMPGPRLDGASLHDLIVTEGVTMSAGVPTVWMSLLAAAAEKQASLAPLRRVAIGGSACPPVMIQQFEAHGVTVLHAWGMTETSPVGLANTFKSRHAHLKADARQALQARQGRPLFGMEFRIADADGAEVPHDGTAFGRMLVRGPWVCDRYFRLDDSSAHAEPGWFETGDVASMDPDGYVKIVDRTKDVIKSGGEWISSIDLENIAVAHPAVREAAVVARPDPRWGERPLLVVALNPGASLSAEDLIAFYEGKVARWCIPDQVRIVDELPHTATGKLLKTKIRALFTQPDSPA